ncbi:phospholipase-like protein [Tanacetum coccineum]
MPSQPGSSNWKSQMPAYMPTPNWQPPIPSHPSDAGLCDPVYMPINVGGNHWSRRLLLEAQIKAWTPVINGILQMRGYFDGSERPYHNFILSYNKGWGFEVPQQANFKDCGVISCWLIAKLCVWTVPVVPRQSERYWENIRYEMGKLFYKCRCENTRYCGYD